MIRTLRKELLFYLYGDLMKVSIKALVCNFAKWFLNKVGLLNIFTIALYDVRKTRTGEKLYNFLIFCMFNDFDLYRTT